jgi:hypothetical protein
MSIRQQVTIQGTAIVPVKDYEITTSERTAKLLYVSDEDPKNVSFGLGLSITIDLIGGTVKTSNLSPQEPSTIYLRMAVRKAQNPDEIPRPNYYPTYAGLTPEQKWIYLNWLCQVSEPVNIGYVFIYYYGIERHLLLGEFDLAFDEILHLRKYHKNHSFIGYSGSALLHSCFFRKRQDRLEDLSRSGELFGLGNAELLMAYQLGFDLTPKSLIEGSKPISGLNRRYLKSEPDLFESSLGECLRLKYGDTYFPFASRYKLADLPKRQEILFANISFPSEIRTPELPSFLDYYAFTNEVRALFIETHERVKISLREGRKRKQ